MVNRLNIKLAGYICGVIIAFIATPHFAFAYVVRAQPDFSLLSLTTLNDGLGGFEQVLGSGFSDNISNGSLTLAVYMATTTPYTVIAYVTSFTSGASRYCEFRDTEARDYSSPRFITIAKSAEVLNDCHMDSSRTYRIEVDVVESSAIAKTVLQVYGTPTVNTTYPQMTRTNSSSTARNNGIWNLGFVLDTTGGQGVIPAVSQFQNLVGVATSSLSQTCANSFATSTGILSDLANGFSVGMCTALSFLFVPTNDSISNFNSIASSTGAKFPFSWFNSVQDILTSYSASSSENFINLTLDFGTTTEAIGFTDYTIISTSTISKYLTDSQREQFKNLIGIAFYLVSIAFIYHSVQKLWNK